MLSSFTADAGKRDEGATPPSARVLGQSLDRRLDKDVEKDFLSLFFTFPSGL